MAKFSEVLKIINGRNQRAVENPTGKYPIYGSGGIMGHADDYICPANTVIIGRKGSINKPIFVETPFWNVDTAFGLSADTSKLYPKYLYYFCQNFDFEKLNTTVTIPSLTKANLLNIDIPLPDLNEQYHIAAVLDKVTDLIAQRRAQLDKLDLLVKSRFLEMFGHCNCFEALGKANIYISDGNYSSKYPTADEFVENGVPFIRASNMVGNTISDAEMYYISPQKHEELLKGHLKPYDVLIATRGAGIGKIAVVPERHNDSNINAQIVLLRCDRNDYNPIYLSYYLKFPETQIKIQSLVSGSAQPQLPIKRLVQLELLKPPIISQDEFSNFAEYLSSLSFYIQQSMDKLDTLKKALMQNYFG